MNIFQPVQPQGDEHEEEDDCPEEGERHRCYRVAGQKKSWKILIVRKEADLQWQPVDNEDKALALHSDVLNFQTLGRNITFLLSLPSIHETEKG